MARFPSSKTKVKSPAAAARWLRAFQKSGKKVVFTNGVFDLIHSGHVTYLEQARALGDALVVALNGDESVKRLKGPERPLNPLEDRARVMAGLGCVDCVTWFHEDTPGALIDQLIPKVLVKGGDWPVEKIVGAATVIANGGKVKSLTFVEGRSTTNIIKKARKGS
jgi:D-beta-D-heptose 7-phosphate kinase/D-beta-D-heptose 1-phosphate adenosyltransferase